MNKCKYIGRSHKHNIVFDCFVERDKVILDSSFEDHKFYTRDLICKLIKEYSIKYDRPCHWFTMNHRLVDQKSIFYKNSLIHLLEPIDVNLLKYNDYRYNFTYLGGKINGRPDKVAMLSKLYQNNLLDQAIWSGGSYTLKTTDPPLPKLPHILDWDKEIKGPYNNINGNRMIHLNFYLHSRFSLTQETEMTTRSNRYTEKTLKCFFVKHPFIIAGNYQVLKLLQKDGFKTFHPYIDESYDNIKDRDERILEIIKQVKILCDKNVKEWQDFMCNINETLKHNFQHAASQKSN